MTRLEFLVNRLRHLTDTLGTLRERVREAVATELGKAVGQAVQDLLHAFARGRPVYPDPATVPQSRSSRSSREWEEDPDPWDEDESIATRRLTRTDESDESETDAVEPRRGLGRWPAAVTVATRVWTWWRTQRGPAWVGVGLGLVAGAAAWAGGPLLTAGLGLVGTAVDLLATGTPTVSIALP